MAFTRDFDKTLKLDHSKFKSQPGYIRDLMDDLEERLSDILHGFTSGETIAGIKKGRFITVGTGAPSAGTGTGASVAIDLYCRTDGAGTAAELYALDKSGNETKLTFAGVVQYVLMLGNQTIAGIKTFTDGIIANVTGNVTGNCSGSSGSCTGNAATATTVSDAAIAQAKLKTTTGEVSSALYVPVQATLPGGSYGFYPQLKADDTTARVWCANMMGNRHNDTTYALTTSYVTNIVLGVGGSNAGTLYAQQRYVTASGKDHWIFLLVDRVSNKIVASWQAQDHPSCGQDDDETKITHPFLNADLNLYDVVLVDNSIVTTLKNKITRSKTLLTIINEDYAVDMASSPEYNPREIIEIDEWGDRAGEVLGEFDTPDWAKIKIKKDKFALKKRMVNTLPIEIKYKKLKKK